MKHTVVHLLALAPRNTLEALCGVRCGAHKLPTGAFAAGPAYTDKPSEMTCSHCLRADRADWYRVVGSGCSGTAHRSIEAAWESFHRNARRAYGYEDHQEGTAIAAHSARLVRARSRRDANEADVSDYCAAWQESY